MGFGAWLGDCFGDAGQELDEAARAKQAQWEALSSTPSPLPGMSGTAQHTTLGPRGLAGAMVATGFGDIIAVEGDCKQGETQVAQLLALDEQLGHPAKYQAAIAALKKSYDDAEGSWSRHVPFSPVCGVIKGIGAQAQVLAAAIAADAGQAALPGLEAPKGSIDKLITGVTTVAVIAGGVWALRELQKGKK